MDFTVKLFSYETRLLRRSTPVLDKTKLMRRSIQFNCSPNLPFQPVDEWKFLAPVNDLFRRFCIRD